MDLSIELLLTGALIILSALFSGLETGFISLNRIKLHSRLDAGRLSARILEFLTKKNESVIGAILVGTNICDVATVIFFSDFVQRVTGNSPMAPVIVTVILTPVILMFSTLLPKLLFREYADFLMYLFSPVLLLFYAVLYPLQFVFVKTIKGILSLIGLKKKKSLFSRDEFNLLVDMTADKGMIKENERGFIESIMDFKNTKAKEIMVPLIRMTCVEENESVEMASALMITTRHTRIPVFRVRVDNMIGYVDNKVLLEANKHDKVGKYVKETVFVHDLMPINQVLLRMQQKMAQMAFVVDEYGGVAGVITNQDIIAEILGEFVEIREDWIKKDGKGWIVNGMLNIDELNDEIGTRIEKQDFETVAGFFLSKFGRLPSVGDSIDHGRFTFEVTSCTAVRIKRLKIYTGRKKRTQEKLPPAFELKP